MLKQNISEGCIDSKSLRTDSMIASHFSSVNLVDEYPKLTTTAVLVSVSNLD